MGQRVAMGLCLLMMAGCSATTDSGASRANDKDAQQGEACSAGTRGFCDCGEGEGSGTHVCSDGAWSSCTCGDNFSFDNAGGDGDAPTGDGSGGAPAVRMQLDNCGPGSYVGTYSCPLEQGGMATGLILEGAVAFDLAIDESVTPGECEVGQEFCFDLVIAEGSGTLFGFVNLFIGFETQLEGGLDCTTGEFHATAVDGIWGIPVSSDPSDPMAPATVSKPPSGMFDGSLDGLHLGGDPQAIAGDWDLIELATGYRCPGPFMVERQP